MNPAHCVPEQAMCHFLVEYLQLTTAPCSSRSNRPCAGGSRSAQPIAANRQRPKAWANTYKNNSFQYTVSYWKTPLPVEIHPGWSMELRWATGYFSPLFSNFDHFHLFWRFIPSDLVCGLSGRAEMRLFKQERLFSTTQYTRSLMEHMVLSSCILMTHPP